MKKLLIVIPLLITALCSAQNYRERRDSLQPRLNQENSSIEQFRLLSGILETYTYSGDVDSTLFILEQMMAIANKTQIDTLKISTYCHLGGFFSQRSDFKQSLEFQMKALVIAKEHNHKKYVWLATKEIGVIFRRLKNYDEALKYLKKAVEIFSSSNENYESGLNRNYTNLADVFLSTNQIDSALKYVQLANAIDSKENDSYGYGRVLYLNARVHEAKGDFDLAESYYKKCISYCDSQQVSIPYIEANQSFGQLLLNNKHFEKAKQFALAGFSKAIETKAKSEVSASASLLRQVYLALGQRDSAYYFADIKAAYRDSVFNEQELNQIQNMNFAIQIQEKEELASLESEKQQRQLNIQFALMALGILVFVSLFLLLSRSMITNTRLISFFGVLALLIVFEFLNLLLHPFLEKITHHSPVLMLIALVCLAALLIPLHYRLEKWTTKILVEKNKQVRLAAAKRTIEKLEGQ
ncbi:MAG: tetratricopeptide repeat protein [Flavobacteriales bacterium]|nr:tetratricopeptide repeat protein [Flavobacteriales bacterium]